MELIKKSLKKCKKGALKGVKQAIGFFAFTFIVHKVCKATLTKVESKFEFNKIQGNFA